MALMAGKGMIGLPIALLLAILVIGTAFIYGPGILYPPAQTLEVGPAVALASQVKNLPTIDDRTCPGASKLVSNVATIIQSMDGTLGTGFGHVAQLDVASCDIVLQYVPILGSYNSLIHDAKTLDPNNST